MSTTQPPSSNRQQNEQLQTQQWWTDNIIAPIMNSHRLNMSSTLIEHQINGYELFVFKYMPDIIREYSKIVFWFGVNPATKKYEFLPQDRRSFATHFVKFQFTPVRYRKSPFTIKQCHLQDETYKFDVLTDVHVTIMDLQTRKCLLFQRPLFFDIVVCSIPIMARSKMCNSYNNANPTELLDPGGYFVLEGKEKVVLAQEEYKYNHPFVLRTTLQSHNRYSWKCEVRSSHFPKIRSTSTVYILLKKQTNDIDIELPFCETFIPILAIFRMMDMESREDILNMLVHGSTDIALIDIMVRIVDHSVRHDSRHKLSQIFVPKSSTVEKVTEHEQLNGDEKTVDQPKSLFQNSLTNEFFPHIGTQWTPQVNFKKLQFLSMCIRKLVLVFLNETKQTTTRLSENTPKSTNKPTGPDHSSNNVFTGRKRHEPDNRDLLDNKRIRCTGYLIGVLFRQVFRDYYNLVFRNLRRKFNKQLAETHSTHSGNDTTPHIHGIQQFIVNTQSLVQLFEHSKITSQLVYMIATGNWMANKQRQRIVTITSKSKFMNTESKTPGQVNTATSAIDQSGSNNSNNRVGTEYRQTYATDQTGVAQSLTRHYPMTVLSHLRRVNKNIHRKGKSAGPRLINESQWGIFCGVSTPEGKACGLLSQLALIAHIRHVSLSTADLMIYVSACIDSLAFSEYQHTQNVVTLFINYVPSMNIPTSQIDLVVHTLQTKSQLPWDVSIYINETDDVVPQIHVVYDEGAPLRPLIALAETSELVTLVKTTPLRDLWSELVRRRIVQYKAKEEEFCGRYVVASNLWECVPEHTHLELFHPGLFSPEILIIPYMNHNQSPRNMFAMNLLRQSVSDIGYNYFNRFDPHNHRLWYPQMPLVQTTQDRDWNLSEIPSGCNCVVQMMCMPYNMEDAIVINKAAIDRGLFRSDVLETYTATDDTQQQITFAKPDFHLVTNLQNANYQTIDDDGLPAVGQPIGKRDLIIGRVSHHDSKFVKQAQAHAANAAYAAQGAHAVHASNEPLSITSPIKVSSVSSSTSRVASVNKISSVSRSADRVSSVKSIVSVQSEHDMKTLREHLQWIHHTEEDTNRPRLAILQNLSPQTAPQKRTTKTGFQKDHSVIMQKELFDQRMVVDQTLVTSADETKDQPSQRTVKVRLRQMRVPEIGDKLSSRHGQKGVIGRIMAPEDMPYTSDGQVADLIINPHCMPSRMTIGQLLESLTGKAMALDDTAQSNEDGDFDNVHPCDLDSAAYYGNESDNARTCRHHKTLPKIEQYSKILEQRGYDVYGNEPMFDATTGRILEDRAIFIGIVYYHRLRHMVADKLYARAKGSVQLTTRQPNEGRSAEGGLRLGEMERDVLVSHGATQTLRDRFLYNSDFYKTVVCNTCGTFANMSTWSCSICHDKADLQKVSIPYALKLLAQELAPAHILLKFSSQKKQTQ